MGHLCRSTPRSVGRPLRRSILSVVTAAACAFAAPSCSAPSKGALILAISTDMQAPKDIDVVSVYITTDGAPKFDYLGRVRPDGTVSLPSTLAIVEPEALNAQIRVRVIAFQTQTTGDANARILRDVITTVPHERTALLRMPLNFLDDGSGTGTLPTNYVPLGPGGAPEGDTHFDVESIVSKCNFELGETSVNGVCTSDLVDSSQLPAYDPGEVFPDGGLQANGTPTTCFDVESCFAGATPVMGLDLTTCSFALPGDSGPASSLNLALVTPDTGACISPGQCFVPLANDPSEGWSVTGGTVRMVPGVCARLQSQSDTQLYMAEGACPSEQLSNPVCEPGRATSPDAGGGNDAGAAATMRRVATMRAAPAATGATCSPACPPHRAPMTRAGPPCSRSRVRRRRSTSPWWAAAIRRHRSSGPSTRRPASRRSR